MATPEDGPFFSTTRTARRIGPADGRGRLLGDILVQRGCLTRATLGAALAAQQTGQARLGDILRTRRLISEEDIKRALSTQHQIGAADFNAFAPQAHLVNELTAEFCLKYGFFPWRRVGRTTIIACFDPLRLKPITGYLAHRFGPISLALATRSEIEEQIARLAPERLSENANHLCPEPFSCRTWSRPRGYLRLGLLIVFLVTVMLIFPNTVLWLGYGWILITLMAFGVLRVLAFLSRLKDRVGRRRPEAPIAAEPLPVVSIMVPLHGEDAILPSLIERLSASEYPVELLDICLVLEAGDTRTHAALARLNLPPWFRAITVPASPLRTKPRAMNYALGFCKGSVIGIYDAEDAPERDQIHRMVDLFAKTGPEVACIQGYLDFYNARRNWLARCFTIEYAIWFRVILHGIERLDLPVPLGGTTVFFRRTALESLGAWDAHNVTEDADLGFRLARLGYRCAFLATTTREEANCRLVPWIRQRSRWLKGYAMTWVTHMRNPAALWRDLGAWRFLAFQVLTLGTISNFVLAPVIWSLWLVSLGFNPAYTDLLPWSAWSLLGTSFVLSEIILFVIGVFAVSGRAHRHLIPWVVTMPIYWPLATLAAYKALFEVIVKPHYWDKTSHGHLSGGERPEKAAA